MPITLTGEVERITYESDATGFRVLKVGSIEGPAGKRGSVTVVGTLPPVGSGTRVRITGDFRQDPRHGEQFRADTLVTLAPETLVGLERYLGSGLIPGIGPAFAKRIVAAFGMDSLTMLDHEPERLRLIPGIGERRIQEVKKAWASQRAISNVMMLLQTHGASPALAARIYKHYGDAAARIVQESPYRLAMEVRGIGFKTADRIAKSLGIAGDHPERVQAGVLHELNGLADQGHVLFERQALCERAAAMLEIDVGHVGPAIDKLWASGLVVVEEQGVYLARLHRAETALVEGLSRLLSRPGRVLPGIEATIERFEQQAKVTLAPAQRAAVKGAAEHKVIVVTGGPGVGKTTIVRAILDVMKRAHLQVRLAAPTGRAAKRLFEATSHEASTLHRLLEFDPRGGGFQLDADKPIEADVVIVDEASMIDVPLGAALISAMGDAARLVIVGDADQLPSVGPGALLRDIIDSGVVTTVRLNEIFRQAGESRIVQNAHRILTGEMPESADPESPRADFFLVSRREAEEAAETVKELVTVRIPRRFGFDPLRDVQVLTPMHRGPAGTGALNQLLQAALNPRGPAVEHHGQTFRVGDKVLQLKNDYDREVYNGDLGMVQRVDEENRGITVRFDGRDVDYQDADIEMLTLAYATSIHKSQGSEYPAVVIPLLTSHFVMLSRNLVYTAVTRGKKLCVLVADPRALKLALGEVRREERVTRLAERLRLALR
ncbi:MAG TPA: ATP-dependent RecD-like DNA helicase [Polyangiaceae bacterium]|nr:ATP-dependent RecD-like DNA helicase [Polyangiaceae bacterium]